MSVFGTPAATHPITGEKKVAKESILDFARRHGWEVLFTEGAADDYYHYAHLRKGDEHLTLSFWPGRDYSIAQANGGTGDRFMEIPEPRRERVERFLLGAECICPPQPDVIAAYERLPHKFCPIHSTNEA